MSNKDKDNNFLIQLIENNTDTYDELKLKNKKLREIIIKITEEIKILNNKNKDMEKEFTAEKQILLNKLDKITNNYKIYAQGYNENSILKKDIGTLINNYKQNNKVLNTFKDSFFFLLKNNMSLYNEAKKLKIDINNIANQYEQFILDLKNKLFNNIIKFKKSIDMINFPYFYKEYLSFVEYEEQENSKSNQNIKSKSIKNNNLISNGNNKYRYKRNSFSAYDNKYSFTKIDLNGNENKYINGNERNNEFNYINNKEKNSGNKNNNKSYKDTNFYRNYFFDMNNNTYNANNINYSKYGKYK